MVFWHKFTASFTFHKAGLYESKIEELTELHGSDEDALLLVVNLPLDRQMAREHKIQQLSDEGVSPVARRAHIRVMRRVVVDGTLKIL